MYRVALLFAVSQEAGPLVRRLRLQPGHPLPGTGPLPWLGTTGGFELLAAVGGMGGRRAASAAESILDGHRPNVLIMAGVAGALDPDLAVGEVLVADRVAVEALEVAPLVSTFDATAVAFGTVRRRMILSLDRVVVSARDKRALRALRFPVREFGQTATPRTDEGFCSPAAVDMETAAVARLCISRGVDWGAVRAISDTASESLPLDFNALRTADGDLPLARVAAAAVRKPASIPGLLRLGRNTSVAATALANVIEEWISQEGA